MTLCFRFDEHAWNTPGARHAIESLRMLLDIPGRLAPPGSRTDPEELRIDVGTARTADSALHIPLAAWARWTPSTIVASAFEGVTLLHPRSEPLVPCDPQTLPGAWLRGAAWVLHREEEAMEPHRDEWGCFNAFSSRLHELGLLDAPLLHGYAGLLARRIETALESRGHSAARVPRWPEDRRFAAVLSHDVDWLSKHSLRDAARLLRQARHPRDYAFRQGLTSLTLALRRPPANVDPYWNFERWMDAEARHGFRSTFYVCHPSERTRHPFDPTYRFQDTLRFRGERIDLVRLMRRMAEAGYEVGLHGSYRSHESGEILAEEKNALERVLGGGVTGIRQHFLRFDARTTWLAQSNAGFEYDSTHGYNEALGFRAGLAVPFHPAPAGDRTTLDLIELPLTAMDAVLFRTLKLSRTLATRRIEAHLDAVAAARGLAGLLWHPNAGDTVAFPGWWDCYLDALRALATRGAWVATAAQVATWWRDREKRMTREGRSAPTPA